MNKNELKQHFPRLGKHFIKKLKQEGLFNQFLLKQGKGLQTDKFAKMINNAIRYGEEEMAHRNMSNPNKYDYITCVLNALLRKYVESDMGIHPERIMKMGQDIFNSFCIEVFGEEQYKSDMDAFHKTHPMGQMPMEGMHGIFNNPNELKKLYNDLVARGVFYGSFREFMEKMMGVFKHFKEEGNWNADMFYQNTESEDEDVSLPF